MTPRTKAAIAAGFFTAISGVLTPFVAESAFGRFLGFAIAVACAAAGAYFGVSQHHDSRAKETAVRPPPAALSYRAPAVATSSPRQLASREAMEARAYRKPGLWQQRWVRRTIAVLISMAAASLIVWFAIYQAVTVPSVKLKGDDRYVNAVAWSEKWGVQVVLSGGTSGVVNIWDAATGDHWSGLESGSSVYVLETGTIADEPIVVSAGDSSDATVWDVNSGDIRATLAGHTSYIESLAIGTIDGASVAITGSDDDTARIWNLETGESLTVLDGHGGKVCNVALGDGAVGAVAVTGAVDEAVPVRVWNASSGALLYAFDRRSSSPYDCPSLTWGWVNEKRVILHTDASLAIISEIDTGVELTVLDGHSQGVNAVTWGVYDGLQVAVTASADGTVQLWDAAGGTRIRTLKGDPSHGVNVRIVEWATFADHPVVITGDSEGVARIWDPKSGDVLLTLDGHESGISGITWGELEGEPIVVTGSIDGTSRVWEVREALTNIEQSEAA